MTNGECIYRKTVDYMYRIALEKDDFRRFSVIWEFRVTGNWVKARVAIRVKMGLQVNWPQARAWLLRSSLSIVRNQSKSTSLN